MSPDYSVDRREPRTRLNNKRLLFSNQRLVWLPTDDGYPLPRLLSAYTHMCPSVELSPAAGRFCAKLGNPTPPRHTLTTRLPCCPITRNAPNHKTSSRLLGGCRAFGEPMAATLLSVLAAVGSMGPIYGYGQSVGVFEGCVWL